MNIPRTLFTIFCFSLLATGGVIQAQNLQSRFMPERSYEVTITKTLSGNDGLQDIAPITSTQRMQIETGAADGGVVPVYMKVYSTVQKNRDNDEILQWDIRFIAHEDGALSDIRVESAAEPYPDDLLYALLSRQLEPVLFRTACQLKQRSKDRIVIGKQTPRDGAEDFIDIEYTIDKSLSEVEQGADREPMATEGGGTALFHRGEQFFVERVFNEVNRIYVAADDREDAKNVIMRKDLRITVDIQPLR